MKITGKVFFHAVTEPDTMYDPAWKLTMVVDKAERDRVMSISGLKFNRNEDISSAKTCEILSEAGEFSINISRKTIKTGKGGGAANTPPKLYVKGNAVSPDDMPDFQWGSKGEIEVGTYNWEFKGRKGTSADFQKLNMLEIIQYEAPEEETTEEPEESSTPEEPKEDW